MLHGYQKPEPEGAPVESRRMLTAEERVYAWRYSELLGALVSGQEAVTYEDLEAIGKLAGTHEDLHKMCDALRAGCSCTLASDIFL